MNRRFLLNPIAGKGSAAKALGEIKEFFTARDGHFDARICESREDLIRNAEAAVREEIDQIVAVGGDGTMNSVACAFFDRNFQRIESPTSLVLAPLGSGSDYFRSISGGRAWQDITIDPRISEVDVGLLTNSESSRSIFLNMSGIGPSAAIVARKTEMPRSVPKKLAYVVPTLLQVPSLRPFEGKLSFADSSEASGRYLAIFVGKGVFAGGGMRFGRDLLLADGQFEVTLIEARSPLSVLRHLPRLFSKGISGVEGVRKLRTSFLRIETTAPIGIEADGELAGTTSAEYRILPRAIRVCTGLTQL